LPLPSPHVGYGESKEKDEGSSQKKTKSSLLLR